MKKRLSAIVVVLALLLALMPATVLANNNIAVTIDGTAVVFADQQPVIVDGRTLVPVAGVFQALGFNVQWNRETRQVTMTRAADTIVITINSSTFITNNVPHTLDVPAQILNGRTMLPIAALLRSVGYEVVLDGDTVVITSPTTEPFPLEPVAPPPVEPADDEDEEEAEEVEDEEEPAEQDEDTEEANDGDVILATVSFNRVQISSNYILPEYVIGLEQFAYAAILSSGFQMYVYWDGYDIVNLYLDGARRPQRVTVPRNAVAPTNEQLAALPLADLTINNSTVTSEIAYYVADLWTNWSPESRNVVVDLEVLKFVLDMNMNVEWDAATGTVTATSVVDGIEDAIILRDLMLALVDEYGIEFGGVQEDGNWIMVLTNDSGDVARISPDADGDINAGTVVSGEISVNVQISLLEGRMFVNEQQIRDALVEVGFLE